jgi:hypothetical protein
MTDPTSERKSLNYAESLGLNSVYDHAQERHKHLIVLQDRLVQARHKKRELESTKINREMEVSEDQHSKHRDLSATAMKEHLRGVFHRDKDLAKIRAEINDQQAVLDQLEFEIEQVNIDIKIAVSRLSELGGYFQFMAVVKQAHEARKAREASEAREADKDPWK